jgi:uncharacterized membrane protein
MPRPDPLPSPRGSMFRNYLRALKWLALFSIVIAAIAVLLVARGTDGVYIHALIATALGVSMMVLLGTGLMVLTFLSSYSGHDEQASQYDEHDIRGDE